MGGRNSELLDPGRTRVELLGAWPHRYGASRELEKLNRELVGVKGWGQEVQL